MKNDDKNIEKDNKAKNAIYYIFAISYIIITFILLLNYYSISAAIIFNCSYQVGWSCEPAGCSPEQAESIITGCKASFSLLNSKSLVIIFILFIGLVFNNIYKINNKKQMVFRKIINIYCIFFIIIMSLNLIFHFPSNIIQDGIDEYSKYLSVKQSYIKKYILL